MVNKPFWHISDFVLASYTFSCVEMSDFVPNNRYLREVLIFFFHLKKTAAEAHREREGRPKTFEDANVIYFELLKPNKTIPGERYRTQSMHLSQALREKRPQYEQRHEKVIPQHDNARPHIAKPVKPYLETI